MKTGIVVGASPLGSEESLLDKYIDEASDIYIVAADGGIEYFLGRKICPDHFIGDMDSIDKIEEVKECFPDIKINSCSPIKDVTDMEIGVEDVLFNKCDKVVIFGGLGGKRLSHMLANIQLMCRYKLKGIDITMYGEGTKMYVLSGGEKKIIKSNSSAVSDKYISILALTDLARNVRISDMFYEYEGNLDNTYALGVSNELKGKDASIALDEGLLLIIEENKGYCSVSG